MGKCPRCGKDGVKAPDNDFLFTYTMITAALTNNLTKDAAADWYENGRGFMKPHLREEAIHFVQDVLSRAFTLHCIKSLGTHRYTGME